MPSELSHVHDRLNEMSKSLTVLCTNVERDREDSKRDRGEVLKLIKRHDEMLAGTGDDNPGLKTKVDRLLRTEDRRSWQIRLIWGGIVAAVASGLSGFFGSK